MSVCSTCQLMEMHFLFGKSALLILCWGGIDIWIPVSYCMRLSPSYRDSLIIHLLSIAQRTSHGWRGVHATCTVIWNCGVCFFLASIRLNRFLYLVASDQWDSNAELTCLYCGCMHNWNYSSCTRQKIALWNLSMSLWTVNDRWWGKTHSTVRRQSGALCVGQIVRT